MKPYLNADLINTIYFLPFVIFTVFIFLPIPVAVVFEAFRVNRGKILLEDRINEKEGLFICFIIIDHQRRGYIDLQQW